MKVIYLLVLVMLASCGGDDFKKIEKLEEFRILAIKADTPEVTPGASVNIQLFVSDIKAAGRTINGTYVACIDPGIAYGAKVSCDHDLTSAAPATYNIITATNGFTTPVGITVPNTIFYGRSTREQFNGIGYIVIFNFTVDGQDVSAFKRITATNRGSFNSNPNGSSILLNGVAISAFPIDNDQLRATSSSPESFNYQNLDGTSESRTEKMQVAWYVSEGELENSKSDIDENVKYKGIAGPGPKIVVAVIRDERGGVDVEIKSY